MHSVAASRPGGLRAGEAETIVGGRQHTLKRDLLFEIGTTGHEPWKEHGFVIGRSRRVQALVRRQKGRTADGAVDFTIRSDGRRV